MEFIVLLPPWMMFYTINVMHIPSTYVVPKFEIIIFDNL